MSRRKIGNNVVPRAAQVTESKIGNSDGLQAHKEISTGKLRSWAEVLI